MNHLSEQHQWQISYLPVDKQGLIDLKQLEAEIRPDTCLISIGLVNNEIGTIQDLASIGQIVKKYNQQQQQIVLHVDAVQAFGHIPLDIKKK